MINQNANPVFNVGLYNSKIFHEAECPQDCDQKNFPQDSGQLRIISCKQKESIVNGQMLVQWMTELRTIISRDDKFCLSCLLIQDPSMVTPTICEVSNQQICMYNGVTVERDLPVNSPTDKLLYGFVLQEQAYLATCKLPTVLQCENQIH